MLSDVRTMGWEPVPGTATMYRQIVEVSDAPFMLSWDQDPAAVYDTRGHVTLFPYDVDQEWEVAA
ncbi:hypothetical protein [uncultured Friedmanniella sp.]|uniref:hypothetical protein n=1 Tax=uncultured Friedmanniella sp. TaxID=335381 RepID=UPI0035C9551C